jgi:formylmethanofuran dehydrogenase subunit E
VVIEVQSIKHSGISGFKLPITNYKITNPKMFSLDAYLREAEIAHGHLCAGQVLGVRLAMLGLKTLGINDPRNNKEDRKRLVTFVEIDRCATDAIAVVTGCRLGKRALKFRDWGKMAATFVDLASHVEDNGKGTTSVVPSQASANAALAAEGQRSPLSGADSPDHCYRAIRIAAKESSKAMARALHPEIENKNQQQMLAYREMPEDDLFTQQWVKVELPPQEFPGYKSDRIACAACGEGINFHREVESNGRVLCRACAGERYYEL